MHEDMKEILLAEKQIQTRSKEIGAQIAADYNDKDPLVIGILKGSLPFMMELVKHIDIYMEMDFMYVSSYGNATESTGEICILRDVCTSVVGRHVLIVEDIIDTGLTLEHLVKLLYKRGAKSVKVVVLLNKKSRRQVNIEANYCCFEIPNVFVVGYGLDFEEHYRNLSYVGVLKDEFYRNI